MQELDSGVWNSKIRAAFWIVGIFFAGITAYTTRYFINGDAIAYIEMGEALRTGQWSGLTNLTYSPAYPVLLGIAQALLSTNPMNELQLLRTVNFTCFLLAMAACEFLMFFVKREIRHTTEDGWCLFPINVFTALCYSMFLVCSLVFVRIRLLNPDMMVFAIVMTAAALLLWIREDAGSYLKFVILGVITGFGYLTKSFFLPFSPIFFLMSGLCVGSVKKSIPRVAVGILAMLIVAAPLMASLSSRVGRFSYGELGPHAYATIISGMGQPVTPEVLNHSPKVSRFVYEIPCTRPAGFDICYWHEGLKPVFNLRAQLKTIYYNVKEIFLDTPWLLFIVIWYFILMWLGTVRIGPLVPASMFLLLIMPAIAGIAFYCLILMEMRYIGPYLFLGFVGLTVSLRFPEGDLKTYKKSLSLSLALISFFMVMLVHSAIDQSIRGLISTDKQLSYRDSFKEEVLVKDFLIRQDIQRGDCAAVIGNPPVYWARMAGIKILAEIPSQEEFIHSSEQQRKRSLAALEVSNIKAVVAKGGFFNGLNSEGWQPVPGTRDYFIFLFERMAERNS
jgi:hypothetical protein